MGSEAPRLQPHPNTSSPITMHVQKPIEVAGLIWSLTDTSVIASTSDCVLRVIDSRTGNVLHSLYSHTREVFALDCHPTLPNVIASGSYDGLVIIWDVIHGAELARFDTDDGITCCKFSPDGSKLIACDITGATHIFGLPDSIQHHKLTPRAPQLQAFEFESHLIREDQLGGLVDEQTQLPASVIDDTQLVLMDINFATYPEYEKVKWRIRKPVTIDEDILLGRETGASSSSYCEISDSSVVSS